MSRSKSVMILSICVAVLAAAPAADAQQVRVLQSDATGVLLEALSPSPIMSEDPRQPGRLRVRIPGYGTFDEEGLPALPFAKAMIAVPDGTRPVLTIVSAKRSRISSLEAAVTQHAYFGFDVSEGWEPEENTALPAGIFPKQAAAIGQSGWMRDARFAEILFHPVRSEGRGGGILLSPRIRVKVEFVPDTSPARDSRGRGRVAGRGDMHERIARSHLLNAGQVLPAEETRDSGAGGSAGYVTESAGQLAGLGMPEPLKISVTADGLYAVRPSDLSAAGVDPMTVNPQDFRVEFMGTPIPVDVQGEGDASFDPNDAVIFYGHAATGPYTRANVYWLHFDGASPRAGTRDGSFGAPASTPASFVTTVHAEQNLIYTQNPPNVAIDHWWWKLQIAGDPSSEDLTYSVATPNLDPALHTATIRVNLQGRTTLGALNPDHHTRIYVGATLVSDQTWDGQTVHTHTASFSSSLLSGAGNSVRIQMVGDTGASVDQAYVNYIEIDYRKTYAASSDRITADGEGTGDFRFSLTGFGGPDILAYDATDPGGLVRITVPPGQITGTGPYTFQFQDNLASDRLYAAATRTAVASAASIVQDVPSTLASTSNGADYIAITPPDASFVSAIQPLLTLRASQGYRVLHATTEDIYDEFNGGVMSPLAIEAFLDHAYASYVPPAPEFLLLAGDAHIDYLDYLGSGVPQYVPAKLVTIAGFGETPSDNEYVTTAGGDLIPEMFAGRLPARSGADLTAMVDKIVAYETSPNVAQLNAQSLFVADNDDVAFEANLASFATHLPAPMAANNIYMSQFVSAGAVRLAIRGGMDAGALTKTYLGHGSVTQLAAECVWGSSGSTCGANDPNQLAATGNLTFDISLNCINGYFVDLLAAGPGHVNYSLAEAMVRVPGRGAVAMYAPAALGTISDYSSIGDWLFRNLFVDRDYVLGRASVGAAILAVTQPFSPADIKNIEELTFFGDPATNLALDSDADGLMDRLEEAAGMDPLDGDSDDDGLLDGLEPNFGGDSDLDGVVDGLDPDSDNDGILDGTEMGVTAPPPGTNVGAGFFVPDADPSTVTDPADPDSDGGGVADGAEDRNFDGKLDPGETDPTSGHAGDDANCTSALPEVSNLTISAAGPDIVLAWDTLAVTHPCSLYRVYVADDGTPPKSSFSAFHLLALTAGPGYTHASAATDGMDHDYLVLAFDPVNGPGPLGHYGQ